MDKEKIPSRQSDWKIFLYFIRYLLPIWDKVLLMLLLAIILTVDINTIILPLVIKKFIDQVLGQQDWYMFQVLLIILVCQIVLYLSCNGILELIKFVVSMKMGINLGMHVFQHALSLPLSFFQQRPVGEHIYRLGTTFDPGFANLAILGLLFETAGSAKGQTQPFVGNDVDSVLAMVTQAIDLIIRVTARLLLIIITISITISASIGLALVLFCIPYVWIIHLFYNAQRRIDLKYRAQSQNFLAGLQEWLAGIKTIKAFGKGKFEVFKNIRLYIKMLRVEWQNYFVKLATDNFIFLFRYSFIVAAILYTCLSEKPTAGVIAALYLLLEQFFSPINQYIRVIEGIRLQLIPARRLMETIGLQPSIFEKSNAVAIDKFSGPYHVNDLSFSYVPEKQILSDITLTISKGKRIGIVGPSGSGKTSLVNLVMRFYDPDQGEILADQVNLKDLKLGNYYQNIGIILQEDFLFSGTVGENIRFGKPDATTEEVETAAKLAVIHDDILKLPDGYDTDLAEGTKLSGGQKQRIAIARALIRQPKILILDEATSSLDSATAQRIEETIFKICNDMTVIMITHKLISVKNFDEIMVIDKGELREQGAFDQLMEQNGLFASLYQQQVGQHAILSYS
ncbi:MAG: ABC transporter ATP-binding protein/permease [bacterium]|nr:ABC transporter ATP-binding protein/permease [bacterium]